MALKIDAKSEGRLACALEVTRNLASFHQSTFEKCKIGSLMGSFYPKYEMHELEIYRGVMCHENEEWCKMWREIDLSFQNWHEEFDEFWPEHSKISKICTLMGCIWPKCIMFEFRKYRGVMFDSNQGWYKIWKKTDLCFQKWHEEFGKFSPEHLKVSKLGLWWYPFLQIWKCVSLKFTGGLCIATMKNDAKFEE